jgi:hypothetical protein
MPISVPSAPQESRPPYVVDAAQIHRWNLAVAVAPQTLGLDASAAELWTLSRHLYHDESLPTE